MNSVGDHLSTQGAWREARITITKRKKQPWEKLGISRATWHRQGKPTHIAQEGDAQLIYTGDHGIDRVRGVVRQLDKKPGLAQFRVVRWKARKERMFSGSRLSRKDAKHVLFVYDQAHDSHVDHEWLILFAAALYKDNMEPTRAALTAANVLDIEVDADDFLS